MRKTTILATMVPALTAGLASAQIQQASGLVFNATPTQVAADTQSFLHNIDIAGLVHNSTQGSSFNKVLRLDLGGGDLRLTALGWDLSAGSQHGLALEELHIAVLNSAGDGVILDPFMGNTTVGAGTATFALHELEAMAFDLSGGEVFIEFFATSNPAGGPEGWYNALSQLTIETAPIPAPGALALTALGGLVATRRRR